MSLCPRPDSTGNVSRCRLNRAATALRRRSRKKGLAHCVAPPDLAPGVRQRGMPARYVTVDRETPITLDSFSLLWLCRSS